MNFTINIDMDRRCAECGTPGACDSGICLDCATKVLRNRPLRSTTANGIRTSLHQQHNLSPFAVAAHVTGKEPTRNDK